jgi:hypothetical protein
MRVRQKQANRGSQKWMQDLVNQAPHLLDRAIARELNLTPAEKIQWLSPLESDGYAEYRDQAFLAKLETQPRHTSLSAFWPARGPQWDALGRTSSGQLLLVEAKAHIGELLSTPCQAAGASLKAIRASIDRVKRALAPRSQTDWCAVYYQYTNRLAHLYYLRTMNDLPAYLAFLYLTGDTEMKGPKTAEEWSGALRLLHQHLGIDDGRLQRHLGGAVIDLFIDVADIQAATG